MVGVDVGGTHGRGRYDRGKLYDKPKKDIWLRPLVRTAGVSVRRPGTSEP